MTDEYITSQLSANVTKLLFNLTKSWRLNVLGHYLCEMITSVCTTSLHISQFENLAQIGTTLDES